MEDANKIKTKSAAPIYNLKEKVKIVFSNISVEPVILFYILPHVLGGITMQNLYLKKACLVDLQYDERICEALAIHNTTGYSKDDEANVQKYVSTMLSYKTQLMNIIPIVFLLFVGPWSDRHNRRKPWILLPLCCEIITVLGFCLTTYIFYELTVIYNVIIEGIAPVMTGGMHAFNVALYAHISCITTEATRTVRLGFANMLVNVCFTLGSALSGVLYTEFGFYGVYLISVLMYITGLIYGQFSVKEAPMPNKQIENGKKKNFFVDFFDMKNVQETFQVAFKKGPRNRKSKVLALMVLEMVIVGPFQGEAVVMYLFVRYKYQWNEIDYSIYCTYYSVVHIVGTCFSLMIFSKYLKLDDSILGMISSLSKILSSFIFAFAPNSIVFYAAVLIEMFNGTSIIATRSIISKLVPNDEIGKLLSLFSLCDAFIPLVYGPMYSLIYNNTIDFMPGMFFIAGGLLTVPSVLMFWWLHWDQKNDVLQDAGKENEVEEATMLEKFGSKGETSSGNIGQEAINENVIELKKLPSTS